MTRSPNTPSGKRRAALYRKAALHIERASHGLFSCSAVQASGGSFKESEKYAALFRPDPNDDNACWGMHWSRSLSDWHTRNDCRVLALCFMAAMVEAGDA